MTFHKGCISDRMAKEYWRDYQNVLKDGNPLGLSFTEYIAHRVITTGTRFVYTSTSTDQTPYYVAACGHKHEWGQSCGTWTEA